jgi:hypothetical protein
LFVKNLIIGQLKLFSRHISTRYHQFAVTQAESLKSSLLRPESSIDNQLRGVRAEEIARNRSVLKHIADAIHLCGTQSIALRGHRDDSTADPHRNKGTFLAVLQYGIRSGDTVLANHFKEASKNATYTSKTIQNQLIEVIGDYIRGNIIGEIKEAKFYSVLCDEVSDVSNKEQLSLVLRFVDSHNCIREEFVDFITTDRITGEALAFKIKEKLINYGLDFQNCRGQGYDGASNMSARRGVQGILMAENSKATYVHCSSHVLNLCIVQACSLQAIRNMNGTVTESSYFFSNSPKRQMFLERVVDKQTKVVKVKDLCRTRWIYRHEAYECFFELFSYLHTVMVAITSRDTAYGIMDWDANTIVTANGLLKMYCTFSFIYSFIVTMNCMSIIKPVSVKLQYKTNDIAYAYSKITDVISELKSVRANEQLLHDWYLQAETLANDIDVQPVVPRTVSRQHGRENVEYNSAEEYYRRITTLPLLDHLIQQLEERFSNHQMFISKLLNLVPSHLCGESSTSTNFDEVIELYHDDLPNPAVVVTEISRWKMKWLQQTSEDRPSTLKCTLCMCDKDFFPNIHILLRVACTLPVTSCENERANSTLANVKTALRSTMGQERLSSLAMMSIHSNVDIDFDVIVDKFKSICNRRISL